MGCVGSKKSVFSSQSACEQEKEIVEKKQMYSFSPTTEEVSEKPACRRYYSPNPPDPSTQWYESKKIYVNPPESSKRETFYKYEFPISNYLPKEEKQQNYRLPFYSDSIFDYELLLKSKQSSMNLFTKGELDEMLSNIICTQQSDEASGGERSITRLEIFTPNKEDKEKNAEKSTSQASFISKCIGKQIIKFIFTHFQP
ncbi:uncharacterized protein [Centruroides vittatus]|uniref:uncharacterized protein n=1 Tax=Centruroides vittatus TaxID=120091 RepID=UPI0035104968